MKGKIIKKVIYTMASITLVLTLIYVFTSNYKKQISQSETDVMVKKNLGTVTLDSQTINTNSPIILANMENGFTVDGSQIVKNAIDLLGKDYVWSGKGGGYENKADATVTGVDCSGLVAYSLNKSGYVISGLGINSRYNVPLDVGHWLTYNSGNSQYMKEVGLWTRASGNGQYTFKSANPTGKSASVVFRDEVTCNKSINEKINVLKVNDIIGDDLRYYEYYDSNGNKEKLPMGTIIISRGGSKNTEKHAWICIGDLGTSNTEEVVKILKERYNIEVSRNNVESEGDCTYWRIESSPEKGVTINNGNPNYLYQETYNGITKKIGAIWAFQVANAPANPEGNYHLNIVKKDYTDSKDAITENKYSEALGGAEFKITQYIEHNKNNAVDGYGFTDANNGDNSVAISKEKDLARLKFTNNGSDDSGSVSIKSYGDGEYDYYTIKETKAPDNYYIDKDWTIGLRVYKGVYEENGTKKLGISKIMFDGYNTEADGTEVPIDTSKSSTWLRIDQNGKVTQDTTNYKVAFEFNRNVLTITWKDPKITKNPKVKVVKKNSTTGETIEGGTFRAYLGNTDEGTFSAGGTEKELGSIEAGNSQYVYIAEESAPEGYINGIKGYLLRAGITVDGTGNILLQDTEPIVCNTNKVTVTNTIGDYYEKLKLEGDTIIFTIKDPPITGSYDVNIKKVNESENDNPVEGVKFKVNGEIKGPTNAEGLATVISDKPITKDNLEETDRYEITEVDLGNNDLIKLKSNLTVYVNKGLDETKTKYTVTSANFEYGDEATNNGNIVETDITLEDGSETKAKLQIINGTVYITIPNIIKGEYKLNIGKKSAENTEYMNSNDDDYISGAKFEVRQYLNRPTDVNIVNLNENNADNIQKDITSEDKKSTKINFNSKENIDITNIETIDVYRITENTAPNGFKENTNAFYLKVYKTIKNHKAVIEKVEVVKYVIEGSYRGEKSIIGEGTIIDGTNTNSIVWGGSTNNMFKVELNKDTNSITFIVGNETKKGSYDFRLTKTDVNKQIIENESTLFDINIYNKMTETNGKVVFSNRVDLKDSNGGNINTQQIKATTGTTTDLNSIKIQKDDIGKTYYFVVEETRAPDEFTKIDYKVVVPITFTETSNGYVATKGEAFAITSTNEKKKLTEMSTDANEVVSTEQTGVTINVNVPNKEDVTKTVIKKWEDNNNTLKNRPTSITVQLIKNDTEVIEEKQLSESNNWTYTWNNLPKYENGKEVNYTIKEKGEVTGYITSEPEVNGDTTIITNTLIQESGTYNVKLVKKGTDGKQLGGVEFTASAIINGEDRTLNTENNPLTTSESDPVQIGETVTINKDNIGEPDKYILKENSIGNNTGYYIGIDKDIVLTVNKGTRASADGSTITNYVTGIKLAIGDAVAQDNVTITLSNGAKATPTLNGNTITITIVNPTRQETGKYNVKLIKKGTDGKQLGGVKFTASAIINGESRTLNTKDNPLTTSESDPVQIGETVTINKDKVEEPDKYSLKEISIGTNTEYYIGINKNIELTINKASTTSDNGGTIINSATGIELAIQGANVIKESETKSTATITVDGQELTIEAELDTTTSTITLTVENPVKKGTFDLNLIKYEKGTEKKLSGAGFTVKIQNKNTGEVLKDGSGVKLDGSKEYFVDKNGNLNLTGMNIQGKGIVYEVTIKETTVPEGYLGLADPIYFEATSVLASDGKTFTLTPETKTVKNTKKVQINEHGILVEVNNIQKPEIHKGVKDVKNQDSGYYGTVEHDWVIQLTVPNGISEFTRYIVTDTIDSRLEFSGVSKVSAKIGDKTLNQGTDYKVSYDQNTRLLKISFIDGNFTAGKSLTENSVIEIRFKTSFAKDENGNIIALNQSVPNQAILEYDNGSGVQTQESEKPEVHTGGIKVIKYEEIKKDGTTEKKPLKGAIFKIATSEENARNNVFIKVKDSNGKDTTTDIVGKSDENGIVVFEGLEFGGDAISNEANKTIYKPEEKDEPTGSEVYDYEYNSNISTDYWIVETEAPKGYIKKDTPVKVTINKDSYNTEVEYMKEFINTQFTGRYSVQLKKVSESNNDPISGAIFKISSANIAKANREEVQTDEDGNLDITNGDVSIVGDNVTIDSDDKTNKSTVDTFEIKEISATSYLKLKNAIKLSVIKDEKDDKYQVSEINISELNTNNETTLKVSDSNTAILKGVKLEDNEKTVDITVSIDDNNNISVTIPNEDLEGEYNIVLLKKDASTGNPLGNVPFTVNGIKKVTSTSGDAIGTLNVTEGNNGIIKIDKSNVENKDVYTIQEQADENTKDYSIISEPIELIVSKGINKQENAYIMSEIDLIYTNIDGQKEDKIEIDPSTNTGSAVFYVKSKNNKNIKCEITIKNNGEIVVTLGNPTKIGSYTIQLHKTNIKNDNTEENLGNVSFIIKQKDGPEVNQKTTDGYTEGIFKSIDKDNLNTIDEYTITEDGVDKDSTIKLKNSLNLKVSKKINKTNNGYVLDKVTLSENNTQNSTGEITVVEGEGATATLSGVSLIDGRTVDISISINYADLILIHVKNREMQGKYTIKVKKLNSVTNEAINGVNFKGVGKNQTNFDITTANDGKEDGIATIVKEEPILNETTDSYTINEVNLPESIKGKFVQLTDYNLIANVKIKMNEEKTAYIVDSVELKSNEIGSSSTKDAQKRIIEKSTYDIKDNVITITIYNEPTQNYQFNIKKVNMEDESIKDAKFTIKENGNEILTDAKLGDLGEYLVTRANQLINQKYTYEIYETTPAPGYDNSLEKVYIVLTISIDSTGEVSTTINYRPTNGGTVTDVILAKRLAEEYSSNNSNKKVLEDNGNNSWTLNIPNQRTTIPFSFNLNKHEVGSENGVEGAVFKVRRLNIEKEGGVQLNDIIGRFTTGTDVETLPDITTSSNNTNISIDSIDKVKLGDSYYYEISEDTVPTNYFTPYKKALIRVYANVDEKITANILAVITKDSDDWTIYNKEAQQKTLSLTSDGLSNVTLNWANNLVYTVSLNKKQFKGNIPKESDGSIDWTKLEGLPGATFTVKQVEPEEKVICDHKVLSSSEIFNNDEVSSGTKYHYEIVENATVPGYTNIFEGLTIHLYVTVNSDGTINTAKNATYYEIKGYTSATQKKYVQDKIGLKVNGNVIDFYIANEEKALKIALMKTADIEHNGNLVGIQGVEFNVIGPSQAPIYDPQTGKNPVTDKDGYIYIEGIELNNSIQTYVFTETSVPEGVTKLEETQIMLRIDTTGITDPDDLTSDNVSVTLSTTGSSGVTQLDGLTAEVQNSTVLLTVPNPVKNYVFNMHKTDELGSIINNADGIEGAKFIVEKIDENGNAKAIHKGSLNEGLLTDFDFTEANKVYKYRIKETSAKQGYINVLQGYEMYVYIETDENGFVKDTASNGLGGYTHYELVKIEGATQLYSEEEIIEGNYSLLSVKKDGNNATINLYIKNPYSYNLVINKKSKNGEINVDNAAIIAERIDGVRANDLYYAGKNGNSETTKTILKEIISSNNKSEKVVLNKESVVTSENLKIDYNSSIAPVDATAQTWRIKEMSATAPYVNILGGNYIIAQTIYRDGALQIVTHEANIKGTVQTLNYYVCDKDGNDITEQYLNVVDVEIKKLDNKWNLFVTVKDPLKFYVDLNKTEYNPNATDENDLTALEGAELTITSGSNSASITNGASKSDSIGTEVGIDEVVGFTITENKTVAGHKNVLENKDLHVMLKMNVNEELELAGTVIVDKTGGGRVLLDREKEAILKYVKFVKGTSQDGYPIMHIYVENPMQYKFKLQKQDTEGNLLTGTEIEVTSSHSGKHYLNESPVMEFTEDDVKPGTIISYTIKEKHSVENSAYKNVFSDTMVMVVRAQEDGTLKELTAYVDTRLPDGGPTRVNLKDLDFLEYGISDPDSQGVQTINFIMQNPTQVAVELLKKQAGENGAVIPDTEFTIISSFSNKHQKLTNQAGKIEFKENNIKAGNYSYIVTENKTANANYVNVLEGKYMKVDVTVSANGAMTINNVKYFNNNNDDDYDNDIQITDTNTLNKLQKYTSAKVDDTNIVNKLVIEVKNPVTINLNLLKETTDGTPLKNVEFEIKSELQNLSTKYTDENGEIVVDGDVWIEPGVYKYEITEKATAGRQYDNLLDGNKIVVYAKVSAEGTITLVADKNGTEFGTGTQYKYFIQKQDGSEVDYNTEYRIHQHVSVDSVMNNSTKDYINVVIENTVGYNMDIVKKNSAGNDLDGTKFTVIRDKNIVLLNDGDVTTNSEITERYMSAGFYTYDITEDSTVENSAYVNILDGKFIRVYTELTSDGKLKIKDEEAHTTSEYFEIYEGSLHLTRNAKLLDRNENAELYNSINVKSSDDDNDGIYTLQVTVTNPINIDVEILKKQVGKTGIGIPNTKFTIQRDEDNKHEDVFTDNEGKYDFREENIKPGDYTYTIKEIEPANSKYVNVLEDKYIEVHINIAENGAIKKKGYKIFNSDGTQVDADTKADLEKYIYINVNRDYPTQKLVITIYNPTTIDFNLYKEDMTGSPINGANFTIKRKLVKGKTAVIDTSIPTTTENTSDDGSIKIKNSVVNPGVYKYEITENTTAGNQYINILENCKLILYVDVAENGDATIVADSEGNEFKSDVQYKYYIEKIDGSVADTELQNTIHKYIRVGEQEIENTKDEVYVRIINPVKYNLRIEKRDSKQNTLNGTSFTVTRDDNIKVVDSQELNPSVEVTQEYLADGEHTYYITEDSTKPGYINMLKGKFVKVYTELTGSGILKIKDQDFNTANKYFEIYEGDINDVNNAKLLDKSEHKDLYDSVDIESVNNNGVYTLSIKVVNPEINYNVVINKKIFGNENINLTNTKFTIISQFSGRHAGLTTDKDGNISFKEEKVPAGIYKYLITETRTSGKQFVNVLKDDLYIVIMLKVNEDGTIEIVDEDGNASKNKYYLYKQRENSTIIDKLDFEDTVADVYINVDTRMNNKVPELDIFVKNPEFYNFELIKKDKDTNERMNGVKFTLTVLDQDKNEVELKDAETLEYLANGQLETKNVNGVDGVIVIPKILIEKAGTYTFILHEEPTDGIFNYLYKTHAQDIKVKVEIVAQNGEYIVKSPTITNGNKYVDLVNTSTSKSQIMQIGVTNERIKGSYDLIIDKLDSYTNKTLRGAEFDVSVEKDGQAYELYKATDDVDSKDVVIPGKVTVNGELVIQNIRIDRPETYIITLTETKAPQGYMLLDKPIKIKVTTARSGLYDDEEYIVESIELLDGDNYGLVTVDSADHEINVVAKNEYFDLALRKSITSISYADSDDSKITEDETKDRVPEVITTDLLANKNTTANYNHVKNHVGAYASQEVIFTLRVYNEGEIDGYAQEITDYLPEGLEFVDDEFNNERGWKLDTNDKTSRTVRTTKLSKEENPEENLIKARDKVTGDLDYKEIQIKCKISDDVATKTVLTNIAEISKSIANNRTSETVDIDSETNNVIVPETSEEMSDYKENKLTNDRNTYVPGQEDDDDFEKLIVEEFDLALRKYITAVNGEELLKEHTEDESANNVKDTIYEREPVVNVDSLKDGSSTTATYTHTKEPVEVSVGDIVTYTLEVYNEGTVSGYASLIKDDIPEGLEFVTYTEGDGSTNDIYRWKMVDENDNEVTDPTKAKYVISDYLSKANEVSENSNLINAYDPSTMSTVDSKYVRIAFRVVCKQDYPKVIKNEAQISEDSDESGKPVKDRDSVPNEWLGEDDEDVEYVRVTYMDLALRKFITEVKDEVTGEEKEVTTRIPQVDASALISETGTTAKYTHPKDPVLVHTTDVVTYTLRVYNEGSKDGYATQIKDDIPDGLEFLPDNETNKEYEWKLVDENDNVVTDISKAKYVVTNYLSKDNETDERQNLMKAFDKETMKTPEYKDVKIAFKVVEPSTSDRILINYAQISEQTDGKGVHREDRDSVPNVWQGEDDEDIEKVRVQYFDLALRKWVTKAIVIQNGAENVTETGHHAEDDPEEVVKVDLKKSKLNSVVVKFEYQIRITNEGEIAGYAKEIKDHIPDGLRFEAADNKNWVQLDDKTIVTEELKDTLLQPGESAEVTVVLTWINSETNMGVKVNIAEISKDYNDYGTPDTDSTPDNEVPGEDDIDDAPVMLTVKTGANDLRYIGIALGVLAILGLGVSLIRDEVNKSRGKKSE